MEFCPGIYEHAAAVVGRSPWDVSRSSTLLAEAHQRAWEIYGQRLVVVGIDVYNIEPEALGAEVSEPAGQGVPAITAHPFREIDDLRRLTPFDPAAGRIPLVLSAAADLKRACRGAAEVRVPVCGPLALANGLLGIENLLVGIIEDEAEAAAGLLRLVDWQVEYLKSIHAAGVRPVIFESGATPPLLPTRLFAEIEAPLLAKLFSAAEEIFGERPPCIIGGDAAPVARDFLRTGPGYVIAPSETDQSAFVKVMRDFQGIHVRVNLPAALLLSSDRRAMESAATAAFRLARSRENSSLGCGVVPYEADPAAVHSLSRFIQTL